MKKLLRNKWTWLGLGAVVVGAAVYFLVRAWRGDGSGGGRIVVVGDDLATQIDRHVTAGRYGEIDSVLVWHRDRLIVEQYYNGYTAEQLHPVFSVTKSVTAALWGAASQSYNLPDVDAAVADSFPEHSQIDPRLTVRHLLTMSGGWRWDEISYNFWDERSDSARLMESTDWINTLVARPQAEPPGETFTYNSAGTVMLGEILVRRSGQTLPRLAAEELFGPLGIDRYRWEMTPGTVANAGWGLNLRPRDMVKIGRLHLQNGRWHDRQIIPADWVRASTGTHILTEDGQPYGYQWWRLADTAPEVRGLAVNDVYYAAGLGGQYIVVVPQLELVVVSTASNYQTGGGFLPAVGELVIPALLQDTR